MKVRCMMKALAFAAFVFCSTLTWAQVAISGQVKDFSGEPLIGASVVEMGTNNGTVTDVDGKFTIVVEPGKMLAVSFIGYETSEEAAAPDMEVVMIEDFEMLLETVVIGYGTMTRKDVTSSITTIQASDMNVGVYAEPFQLLQGKVPGLTIVQSSDPCDGKYSISLRGASSLRSGDAMEPFYVIDGVPGLSLSLVSPDDIESIDVLRDASATAIYGSKAANGVIVVTTKHGNKEGHTDVSYSGYFAVDNALKNLDMMSADELRAFASKNGIKLLNDKGYNTNWQDEVLRTAISQNHNVSISGGNEATQYSASINYLDKTGIVKGTSMDRMIGRTFLETNAINNHLKLSISLNGSIQNSRPVASGSRGESVYDAMYYYSPLVPVKNEDGSWYDDVTITQNHNPLAMVYEDRYKVEMKKLQGAAKAGITFVDGLVWNSSVSYQTEQWTWNDYNTTKSQVFNTKNGRARRMTSQDIKRVFESYLNYDKAFNMAHKLGLMVGYSWEESSIADGFGLTVYDFYNDELEYHNLKYANKMDISDVDSYALSILRMISFFGRVNYSFNSKYLVQATLRRDGSSAFGKNNRWATFPSVSAAWRMSEEDFIRDIDNISDLKFRVGYGVSGNSLGFDAFTSVQTYGSTGWFTYTDPETGMSSEYMTMGATKNANPDLKWESTSMLNVGLDYGFLRGRVNGTIEFYNKKTSDLIYNYAVSTNRYPYPWITANVGEISNKGVEFSLNVFPIQNELSWETGINISHNKNILEKLSNSKYSVEYIDTANPDVSGGMCVQRMMEGKTIGTFYLLEWAGYNADGVSVFNDYDEDGNYVGVTDAPDDSDRREAGCAQPKLTFGWNNTFNYKKWTLTAFLQGVAGNKIFNATRCFYNNISLVTTGKNVLSEVATDQKITDSRAHIPSDRYLENGSYARLSTLSLAYNFGKIGDNVKDVKVYATCNNVFTITKYKGIDPEIALSGTQPGMDWRHYNYPRTRTFMVGVNVNF